MVAPYIRISRFAPAFGRLARLIKPVRYIRAMLSGVVCQTPYSPFGLLILPAAVARGRLRPESGTSKLLRPRATSSAQAKGPE